MTHASEPPFMKNVINLPLRLPPPFAPGLYAANPPAHCLCCWTWTPSLGGKHYPFALKFWNRACPVNHFRRQES